jgi:hypothetical protein
MEEEWDPSFLCLVNDLSRREIEKLNDLSRREIEKYGSSSGLCKLWCK